MLRQMKWAEVTCKLYSFTGFRTFTSVDKEDMQKGEDMKSN